MPIRLSAIVLLAAAVAAVDHGGHSHDYGTAQIGLGEPGPTVNGISFATRAHWMRQTNEALFQLRGTPCPFAAFGTVIVNHTAGGIGDLVCIGVNTRSESGDPTMHGEIAAIRNCSAVLIDPHGRHRLTPSQALDAFSQLTLYTNGESCPMCASAIRWAGFREYVYGTSIATMTRKGWGNVRMSSPDVFLLAFEADGSGGGGGGAPNRVLGSVLANETDPLLAWQFDPAWPCPRGCRRELAGPCVPVG